MDVFTKLLEWLTSSDGGAFIVAAFAISWALEGWSWWDGLKSKWRSLIILGVALVLAIPTVWLMSRPDVVEAIRPYATVVIYVITAWLATQTAHRLDSLRTNDTPDSLQTKGKGK